MNRRRLIAYLVALSIFSSMPKLYIQSGVVYYIPEKDPRLTQEEVEEAKQLKKRK